MGRTTDPKAVANCIDCKHAQLVQYAPENPIIAICDITNSPDVARLYSCRHYEMKRGVVKILRKWTEK